MFGAHRDLCSTCNQTETCINRGTPERPVFYCEEFSTYSPEPPRSPARVSSADPDPAPGSDKCQGLCLNCENRSTCCLQKPEGGVWHCEEYR